ncbi:MAG: hypothetical protein E6R03_10880 [Hyphomicrobiaceae bacterium]|nr:MAG: hypothetical protein E6R03_10880 [Hyphomicrobiaceae bacterium]
MKTQHTPGPWCSVRDGFRFTIGDSKTGNTTTLHNYLVAEIHDNSLQAEANARLIATAPELLQALELLFNEVSFYNEKEVFPEPEIIKSGFAVIAWNKAKAAIAKAKTV